MPTLRTLAPVLLVLALGACRLPALEGAQGMAEPMDADRVLIGRVQGGGPASPLSGQDVVIEAVVVRSLMGDGDDVAQAMGETLGEGNRGRVVGWFVQDEGDGDPTTSDALFVMDQGYDTSINLPAEAEYTLRLGSLVRTGDRVTVRGTVAELPLQTAAEQPRSSGHRVARGDPAGSMTAVLAHAITLLEPRDRARAIAPEAVAPARAQEEAVEGMRLQAPGPAQPH
ncbi:hypothetical protein SQW19_09570 [Stenotrophomonas acidaminiphila]|uniref:hypothetical protein n=2 Tax=Stenotrophomonas acidaminiphila TaxID=128780 RepID=UPI002ABD6EDA|nr:hypothetical protein [Stenotrophomonas acidaminiphila]WPU54623.1 hypothetical protein SQW19_09570 [Stenotrophomonas acidaminiphila]